MNRTDLIALKEKVEAGEFPADVSGSHLGMNIAILTPYEAFSGSLDAARALHDAVLPGWFWAVDEHDSEVSLIGRNSNGKCVVRQTFPVTHEGNPARAWLIAILSALIAMDPAP